MMDLSKVVFREETTNWDYPNHIYMTRGTECLGYIKRNTKKMIWFKTSKKTWSSSRRTFRKLSKSEINSLT